MPMKDAPEWRRWMKDFGVQQRSVREALGLSQERLAHMAGVSQGAVSRLESGRGLATPMVVILKINVAMVRELKKLDPSLLNDELRRAMQIQEGMSPPIGDVGVNVTPVVKDTDVQELLTLYRKVPERQRKKVLGVIKATVEALLGTPPAAASNES